MCAWWLLNPWPSSFRSWANDNYERLAWFGPSVALGYWDEGGLGFFGPGVVLLLAIAAVAWSSKTPSARLALLLLFCFFWVSCGIVASVPWY
jgi:hypothetical protein